MLREPCQQSSARPLGPSSLKDVVSTRLKCYPRGMDLVPWPIVGRDEVVKAFRPGMPATEAPFRTLRAHGWASSGMSVVTRRGNRASGRWTIFSTLNIEAARYARHGDG